MLSRILSLAAIATVALTACASPAPSPSAAPSASSTSSSASAATPTPSPTSTPSAAAVPAELVISTVGVQLYDSEGTEIGAFAWADEATTALPVLETAFGDPSATGLVPGDGSHYADYETYTYPGGFMYYTAINLGKPRSEYHAPSSVRVDASGPINGVVVRTSRDLKVGSPLAQVLALSPALNRPHPLGTVYMLDPLDPAAVGDPEDSTDTVGVIVNSAGSISVIIAPWETNPL